MTSTAWALCTLADPHRLWSAKGSPVPALYGSKMGADRALQTTASFPDMARHYRPVKVEIRALDATS